MRISKKKNTKSQYIKRKCFNSIRCCVDTWQRNFNYKFKQKHISFIKFCSIFNFDGIKNISKYMNEQDYFYEKSEKSWNKLPCIWHEIFSLKEKRQKNTCSFNYCIQFAIISLSFNNRLIHNPICWNYYYIFFCLNYRLLFREAKP